MMYGNGANRQLYRGGMTYNRGREESGGFSNWRHRRDFSQQPENNTTQQRGQHTPQHTHTPQQQHGAHASSHNLQTNYQSEWGGGGDWGDGDVTVDEDEQEIVVVDAVVIRVKDHFGHMWSPKHGRIYFTQTHLTQQSPPVDMGWICPGAAASVKAERNEPSAPFPDIKWKAVWVELKAEQRAPSVVEGEGTVTRTRGGFGFLTSSEFDLTLFVPGFAATNNLLNGVVVSQMEELEGELVHFLAIPNPKRRFRNYFVIALHYLHEDECRSKAVKDTADHWLNPSVSQQPAGAPTTEHTVKETPTEVETVGGKETPSALMNDFATIDISTVCDEGKLADDDLFCVRPLAVARGSGGVASSLENDADADAAVVWTTTNGRGGWALSSRRGLIYFERPSLKPPQRLTLAGLENASLVVGQSVSVTLSPNSAKLANRAPLFAVATTPAGCTSELVSQGLGIWRRRFFCGIVLTKTLDGPLKDAIFTPGWVNGCTGLDSGTPVHYLMVRYGGSRCVIAVHASGNGCFDSAHKPMLAHWVTAVAPQPVAETAARSAIESTDGHSWTTTSDSENEEALLCPTSSDDEEVSPSAVAASENTAFTDCYFTYVRANHGYLRSTQHGTIVFVDSHVVPMGKATPQQCCFPGVMATVHAVRISAKDPLRRSVHSPQWRATRVEVAVPLLWSPDVEQGRGRLFKVRRTYGMLKCFATGALLFVPGWAGVNNVSSAYPGYQIPQLADVDLHFLAMPNPKRRHQGERFVVAVHRLTHRCTREVGPKHWIRAGENSNIVTEDFCTAAPTNYDIADEDMTDSDEDMGGSGMKQRDVAGTSKHVAEHTAMQDDGSGDLCRSSIPPWAKVRRQLIRSLLSLSIDKLQSAFDSCPNLFKWGYYDFQKKGRSPKCTVEVLAAQYHRLQDIIKSDQPQKESEQ